MSSGGNGIIRKLIDWLNSVRWIFKVSKKPSRNNYMVVLKLGSLIVAILGVYSFLFNIAGEYLLGQANFALSYPLNLIVILTVVIVLIIMLVVVILSTRGIGRS